jgi:NADH:ubiquinone oxidoreductase subunit 2 (subunit N)
VTLLLLLGVGAVAAGVSAWGLGRGGRTALAGAIVGVVGLVAVLVLALAMAAPRVGSGEPPAGAVAFDGRLVPNDYLRLVVGLWAFDSVLIVFIGWLLAGLAGLRGLLPATLAAIVGGTIAFAAADLTLGSAAASGVGLAAVAGVLAGGRGVAAAARELRVTLVGSAALVVVTAAAPAAATLLLGTRGRASETEVAAAAGTEPGAVVGLLALTAALAVALRLGVIPFHLRVPRLTDVVPPVSLPLLLAWIPVPLAVVGLAIFDALIAPLALPLEGERWIVVSIAIVTLLAGALAAFIQDDLRHATGYLVISDAALVLLGFAALDPAAWGPTRVWLVAMAASKTALGAWAAVMEDRFATRSIPDLRGWLRHSPILGAGLAIVMVATYGLPGWIAFSARGDLARLAGASLAGFITIAGLATLPTYVRLLALGTGPATSRVRRAAPDRLVGRGREAGIGAAVLGAPDGTADGARVGMSDGARVAPGRVGRARPRAGTASVGRSVVRSFRRLANALRHDRTELLAASVLALAVLAALTSWGALDLGSAASEAAPIVAGPSSD